MEPLISIIIPNFNDQVSLSNAINSVLMQTYQNWELIIVDDNSTDQSRDIIFAYSVQDCRIKKIFLEKNIGTNGALNIGLKIATGSYVFGLSANDYIISNVFFMDAMIAFSQSKISVFFGRTRVLDRYGREMYIIGKSKMPFTSGVNIFRFLASGKLFIPGSSAILDRSIVDLIGGFDHSLGPQADFALNHICASLTGAFFSNKNYTIMNFSEESFSQKNYLATESNLIYFKNMFFKYHRPNLIDSLYFYRWIRKFRRKSKI